MNKQPLPYYMEDIMKNDFQNMMFFTSKMVKHLANRNVKRVKDYLAHLIVKYPDLDNSPVDVKLLKQCMNLIRDKYKINKNWKSGDGVYTVFIKLPM